MSLNFLYWRIFQFFFVGLTCNRFSTEVILRLDTLGLTLEFFFIIGLRHKL
jgi:hypothetical protein